MAFHEYRKTDLEVLVATGAKEITSFSELHGIKEGWEHIGNYDGVNEYGCPTTLARVLKGNSGKIYIYWL